MQEAGDSARDKDTALAVPGEQFSCFLFQVFARDDVDQVWDGGVAEPMRPRRCFVPRRPRHLDVSIRHLGRTEIEEDSLWCL